MMNRVKCGFLLFLVILFFIQPVAVFAADSPRLYGKESEAMVKTTLFNSSVPNTFSSGNIQRRPAADAMNYMIQAGLEVYLDYIEWNMRGTFDSKNLGKHMNDFLISTNMLLNTVPDDKKPAKFTDISTMLDEEIQYQNDVNNAAYEHHIPLDIKMLFGFYIPNIVNEYWDMMTKDLDINSLSEENRMSLNIVRNSMDLLLWFNKNRNAQDN